MNDIQMLYTAAFERFPFLFALATGGFVVAAAGMILRRMAWRSSAAQKHLILSTTAFALLLMPIMV